MTQKESLPVREHCSSTSCQDVLEQCRIRPCFTVDMGGGKSAVDVLKDKSPTLTTTHYGTPAVCYGICSYHSNAMKSSNPYSGFYVAETARTLDALQCGYPACNQGWMAIVECYSAQLGMLERFGGHFYEEMSPTLQADATGDNKPVVVYGCDLGATRDVGELFIEECSKTLTNGSCPGHHNHVVICIEGNGSRPSHQGDGYKESEQMYTLNTTEVHAVCYAEKRFFDWEEDDRSVTIRNKGGSYGGVRSPHCGRDTER